LPRRLHGPGERAERELPDGRRRDPGGRDDLARDRGGAGGGGRTRGAPAEMTGPGGRGSSPYSASRRPQVNSAENLQTSSSGRFFSARWRSIAVTRIRARFASIR